VWFFPPTRGRPYANVCIELQSLDPARTAAWSLTGAGHLVKMFRGSIDTETAVFSRFRYRQSPFVGSVWLDTLSNGRLHPFGGEGSVPQADAGQLHDRI